jgi:hypothetical protein
LPASQKYFLIFGPNVILIKFFVPLEMPRDWRGELQELYFFFQTVIEFFPRFSSLKYQLSFKIGFLSFGKVKSSPVSLSFFSAAIFPVKSSTNPTVLQLNIDVLNLQLKLLIFAV